MLLRSSRTFDAFAMRTGSAEDVQVLEVALGVWGSAPGSTHSGSMRNPSNRSQAGAGASYRMETWVRIGVAPSSDLRANQPERAGGGRKMWAPWFQLSSRNP